MCFCCNKYMCTTCMPVVLRGLKKVSDFPRNGVTSIMSVLGMKLRSCGRASRVLTTASPLQLPHSFETWFYCVVFACLGNFIYMILASSL